MITKFQIHELFPNAKTIDKPRNIIVYHGTKKYFDDFDFKKVGSGVSDFMSLLGIHFTESFDIAKTFIEKGGKTNRVITCELDMKKKH